MKETPEWWDTRALVPDYREIIVGGWKPAAAAYRRENPPEELRYGEGERHVMDVFGADSRRAPLLFMHGGFWQAPLDRSDFSHLAQGPNALGVPVAVMSYDLCPTVSIEAILEQISRAARVLMERTGQAIVVSGHSAGGHGAAHLLRELGVKAAYAISGVFDLSTLVGTPLNDALKLDPETADKLSPLKWKGPRGKSFDAVVGTQESEGFRNQTAAMARTWQDQGVVVRSSQIPNAHHLNVIAGLADPDSPMSQRIFELSQATPIPTDPEEQQN